MVPVKFKQVNKILTKPESMTDEECSSLPVFNDGVQNISCWELSEKELEVIKSTKKVWVSALSGHTQPPICIMADDPFNVDTEEPKNDISD